MENLENVKGSDLEITNEDISKVNNSSNYGNSNGDLQHNDSINLETKQSKRKTGSHTDLLFF